MRLLLTSLLVAAAWAASGRTQEPEFQLRVDVPLVSVDVRVVDSRGEPLTTLAETDFVVLEEGEEQKIQVFSSVDTPYNILLLFDRSGSTLMMTTNIRQTFVWDLAAMRRELGQLGLDWP